MWPQCKDRDEERPAYNRRPVARRTENMGTLWRGIKSGEVVWLLKKLGVEQTTTSNGL